MIISFRQMPTGTLPQGRRETWYHRHFGDGRKKEFPQIRSPPFFGKAVKLLRIILTEGAAGTKMHFDAGIMPLYPGEKERERETGVKPRQV
jgi:hypothetical protein